MEFFHTLIVFDISMLREFSLSVILFSLFVDSLLIAGLLEAAYSLNWGA